MAGVSRADHDNHRYGLDGQCGTHWEIEGGKETVRYGSIVREVQGLIERGDYPLRRGRTLRLDHKAPVGVRGVPSAEQTHLRTNRSISRTGAR